MRARARVLTLLLVLSLLPALSSAQDTTPTVTPEGTTTAEATEDAADATEDASATEEAAAEATEDTEEESEDDAPVLADALAEDDDVTIFVEALAATGLAETLANPDEAFTVLVPRDGAFGTFRRELGLSQEDLLADTELLTAVLAYHILPGLFVEDDLKTLYDDAQDDDPSETELAEIEALSGEMVLIGYDEPLDFIMLNERRALIADADEEAANGVYHVLDNVLYPPDFDVEAVTPSSGAADDGGEATGDDAGDNSGAAPAAGAPTTGSTTVTNRPQAVAPTVAPAPTPTVEDAAPAPAAGSGTSGSYVTVLDAIRANGNLTTLAAAAQSGGVADVLANPNVQVTVFAPTDAAFASLASTLGMSTDELLREPLLGDILRYHAVGRRLNGVALVATRDQSVLTLLPDNYLGIRFEDGGVQLNNVADVRAVDIEAGNGVVHIIDQVLLPLSALEAFDLARG